MVVSLTKGQKISLEKEAGTKLTRIVMGLGWDPIKKKGLFGSLPLFLLLPHPPADADSSAVLRCGLYSMMHPRCVE